MKLRNISRRGGGRGVMTNDKCQMKVSLRDIIVIEKVKMRRRIKYAKATAKELY
jgi:hypothetical protein